MSDSTLTSLRNDIDRIDSELLQLFSERFMLVKKVWEYKKDRSIPALQEDRWQQVLESRISEWKRIGIPPGCVQEIWNAIHKNALDLENNI